MKLTIWNFTWIFFYNFRQFAAPYSKCHLVQPALPAPPLLRLCMSNAEEWIIIFTKCSYYNFSLWRCQKRPTFFAIFIKRLFMQLTFRLMICWCAYFRLQFLNSFMGSLLLLVSSWRMNSRYVLTESEIFRIGGGIVLVLFTKASS